MNQEAQQPQDEVAEAAKFADVEGMTFRKLHTDLLETVKRLMGSITEPWSSLSEREKGDHVDRVSIVLDTALRRAVDLIAAEGRVKVGVTIDSVKFGDDIKIALTAAKGAPDRHAIADAAKGGALLVLNDYVQPAGRGKPQSEKPADTTGDLFDPNKPAVATSSADPETTENPETTTVADGTEPVEPIKGPFTEYVEGQGLPPQAGVPPDDGFFAGVPDDDGFFEGDKPKADDVPQFD